MGAKNVDILTLHLTFTKSYAHIVLRQNCRKKKDRHSENQYVFSTYTPFYVRSSISRLKININYNLACLPFPKKSLETSDLCEYVGLILKDVSGTVKTYRSHSR